MALFAVPQGVAETDVAARLFSNFRELYGLFTRVKAEESLRQQMRINRTRPDRVFYPGEIAFRRLPPGARLPKHLFPEPSTGPYEVAPQPSSSVVLRNVETKELVDQGRPIPLDQILNRAFPGASSIRTRE